MTTFSPERLNETELLRDAWADLDITAADELDRDQRQAVLNFAQQYQAAFELNEAGKFVLDDLVKTFLVEQPVALPGDDDITIGIRQGTQNIVRRILHFVELSRRGGV